MPRLYHGFSRLCNICKPACPGSVQTLHNHTEMYSRKHISQSENTCNGDLQHVIATVQATCMLFYIEVQLGLSPCLIWAEAYLLTWLW